MNITIITEQQAIDLCYQTTSEIHKIKEFNTTMIWILIGLTLVLFLYYLKLRFNIGEK